MQYAMYKGLKAIHLENDQLRLTFLPDYACKLVSLVKKQTGREFLFQSHEQILSLPHYGAAFSDFDSSGFDEVIPSIDACPYPDGVYKSVPIPDHGEVWAMKWKHELLPAGTALNASVHSEKLPYTFSRLTELKGNEIIFHYTLTNLEEGGFKFIWTPHCLLTCSVNTRLLIPDNLHQIMTVEHGTKHLGPWGTLHPYPMTTDAHGHEIDLSATEPVTAKNCEKFYFTAKNSKGWCGVEHTDNGDQLIYEYDADKVPYLGIWKTQGGYRGDYNIALEPCTGVYDDLYVANKLKKVAVVPPLGQYTWQFKMIIK